MSDKPPAPKESGDEGQDDLVFLLRMRAKIETAGDEVPVTQHIDWMAAQEITRLRDSVKGLMETIRSLDKFYPHAP